MIKLNNKNITYVALADTNNSLKAPKEIWYADSSNSVKLVYMRKDALIEGEDYEKYHWLVGDNIAYIQGVHYNLWDNHLQMNIGKIQDTALVSDLKYFYYNINNDYFIVDTQLYNSKYRLRIRYRENAGDGHIGDIAPYSSMPISLIIDFYIEDGRGYVERNGETFVGNTTFSQDNWTSINPRIYSIKMSYIREVLTDNSYQSNLIPCKLLKPVPKWLDANGIRRNIGECGMIDLISGKFYGNVNSVGTFTVENYYERKEWLQGRNGAYINTGHKLQTLDDTFIVRGRYDGVLRNPSGYEQAICGVAENVSYTENGIWDYIYISQSNHIKPVLFYTNGSAFYDNEPLKQQTNEFLVILKPDGENYYAENNGVGKTFSTHGVQDKQLGDVYLFTRNSMNIPSQASERYFHGDIAYFKITDTSSNTKMNLIPCTLTMDLPASMDANNIPRTKGTSGMWDLVSDRFYGNVASRGTFKAVNLAEGVDYEVHQWLGSASGTPYLKVQDGVNTDENAYVETTYKCNYSNAGTDIMIGVSINESNNIGIRIFNSAYNGGTTYVDYHKTVNGVLSSFRTVKKQDNINAERYIKATFDKLIIDNSEYQISFGNGFDNIKDYSTRLHFNANNNAVRYKRTKIRVNNVEYDLIPVKLLRSIPSKYDANGIARQVGECGMYDTVNDVFYGNVASSGTFTVSDDN